MISNDLNVKLGVYVVSQQEQTSANDVVAGLRFQQVHWGDSKDLQEPNDIKDALWKAFSLLLMHTRWHNKL